jgi:hypothetical protein
MRTHAPTPREILADWARNRNGIRRTPWIDIQCFGLPLNENLSEVCQSAAAIGNAAGVDCPSAPAATFQENE